MSRTGIQKKAFALGAPAVVAFAACALDALAAPETWIVPSISFEGTAASGRFGDALACSKANATTNDRSYIAVGAPNENSGQGRVYIFDADAPSSAIVSISSPNPAPMNFGAAVAFIVDQNGDDIDDLAVGEPGTGSVYIYTSATVLGVLTYQYCKGIQIAASYGANLLGLRGPFTAAGYVERLVVADPDSGTVHGLDLSGGCASPIQYVSRFVMDNAGSRLGTSLAELPDTALGDGDTGSDVLAGQPDIAGNGGRLVLLESNEVETAGSIVSEQEYGSALGGSYLSDYFGVGSPYRNSGRGGVDIHNGSSGVVCSAEIPPEDSSSLFGSSMAHLHLSFPGLFASANLATFASHRSESTTGGSVALFAYTTGGQCNNTKQVNNCIGDATQEQGKVIVGGPDCLTNSTGTPRRLMVFSSPGWSSNKGRVDVVIDGTELGAAQACGAPPAPTSTPTPTATHTTAPTNTPSVDPVEPSPTPVPLGPGAVVPPPSVSVEQKVVTVIIPDSKISLTAAQTAKLIKTLMTKYKQTKAKATALANNPANFTITYNITISPSSGAAGAVTVNSTIDAAASAAKKRQIKSRLNRVSVRGLPAGRYSVVYAAQISIKKPKPFAIGNTKKSSPTAFKVG